MNKKKNICFITPNLGKGGMERFLSIVTKELAKSYSVIIITLQDNIIEYTFDENIRIIHINKVWKKNIIATTWKLFKILRRIKPDVVLGFNEIFNPIIIFVSRINRLKVYISDRSNPLLRHKIRDRITRFILYPFANGMIAQTELAKQTFLSKGFNNNICVVANPLINFRNAIIDAGKKYIITTGSLAKSKNQQELIEIFSKANHGGWSLILVGEGTERTNLENRIQALNLTKKVKLAGKQDDIEFWLNKGSIYMYTSLSEGFPNALSEALASPLATIAYDCPAGVADLITDNENGFLIPLGDQKMYIEKLNQLIISEELRRRFMIESIKSRQKYNVEEITEKIINFIKI